MHATVKPLAPRAGRAFKYQGASRTGMLAVVGGKGGCGKTTTALGLARALARFGERPVVVDADCDMPNLHTMARTDRRPGLDAVTEGAPVERALHSSRAVPGVDVLPAGTATGPMSPRTVRQLASVDGRVLLDCPAGASRAVATPLRGVDSAIVVSTPDRPSMDDAAKTVRMARALDVPVRGAVVTRAGDSPEPVTDQLGSTCAVLATVPEIETGRPVLDQPAARAAHERLARRIQERNV